MSSKVVGSKGNNQQPATRPITDLAQAHGRPAALDASDHGRPIGERGNAVTVADQHVARMYPEGAIHQVPAPTKVRQHSVDPPSGQRRWRCGPGRASRHRR
jgi:hypothetical protein